MFPWFLVGRYVGQGLDRVSSSLNRRRAEAEERAFKRMSPAQQAAYIAELRRVAAEEQRRKDRANTRWLIFFLILCLIIVVFVLRASGAFGSHSQPEQPGSANLLTNIDDYTAIRSSLSSESYIAVGTMSDVPGLTANSLLHVQRASCAESKCERLFIFVRSRAVWAEDLESANTYGPLSILGPGRFADIQPVRLPDDSQTLAQIIYRWDGSALSRTVEFDTSDDTYPIPGKGYRYKIYPSGYMVGELCSSKAEHFCYLFDWKPWLKELETKIAGEQAGALLSDTEVASPGNLVILWDNQQRVVFSGCRAHDCPGASAYFIVAPATREMDIIWKRGDEVTYLGPNAASLRNARAYDWLEIIRQ